MGKIGLVIAREYWTRVRKKSFIIMTFLGPVLFGGLMLGAVLIGIHDDEKHLVRVFDAEEVLSDDGNLLVAYAQFFEGHDNIRYEFASDPMTSQEFLDSPYTISLKFTSDLLNNMNKVSMEYDQLPSLGTRDRIRSDLRKALEVCRVKHLDIDYEQYKRAKVNIDFSEFKVTEDGGTEESVEQEAAFAGFAFAFIIYLFIFIYGAQVMRGVIEEKTNRIVEVIVSSVKPFQLMMGKVIGIGLVGLTQFLMWVVLSAIIMLIISLSLTDQMTEVAAVTNGMPGAPDLAALESGELGLFHTIMNLPWALMVGMFVFYFVGGFLMYGSLFAAIGAAADSETDTQQFMLPISLPLIFGFIVAQVMIQNPASPIGNIFAIFPLTAPVVSMVKVPLGFDPWVQIPSMLLLILAFIGTVWLAGRIYRTGILMYGKKASYKELWKWLFYKN